MSDTTLHILNGDSTLQKFNKVSIPGQCMVWREVLTQGPLFYQIDSELFWEMRSQFMEEAYGAKLAGYRRKVISEFNKLKKFNGEEIVLWFEYDLFCQINFIALMSYLLKKKKTCKVSMICVGDYPGREQRVGLGQIPSTDYLTLFSRRQVLLKKDLLLADQVWMTFCGKQVDRLKQVKSDVFIYLEEALKMALQLFGDNGDLSPLEKKIKELRDDKKLPPKEIIKHMLTNDNEIGFGDLQYAYILSIV